MAHAYLAGAFSRQNVDVKIYSEFHSGPLNDEAIFNWPDMLVLTGVTSAFDRMRQLSAYARTKSPGCIVVAGGPSVRSLPKSSAKFFDHACLGDIEELKMIVSDALGRDYAAEEMLPRFDLLEWRSPVNYVESSRYCNFKCSFCSLTGENRKYVNYDVDYVERQIREYRSKKIILFIDNNFYGNNRSVFLQKLDMLRKLYKAGTIPGWCALVTGDFFSDPDNLARARDAGCLGLFSGVESFDDEQIRRYRKKQNIVPSQIEMISSCLERGIVFQYGLMFDPTTQRVGKMREELSSILHCPEIPLPAFLSLTIPLLGTPYFKECINGGQFLPHAKLRDMDGFTLMTRPLDDQHEVVDFVRKMARLEDSRLAVLSHCMRFAWRYRSSLSPRQILASVANGARLCVPELINNRRKPIPQGSERLTYVTTTQPLGPLYTPLFKMPAHHEPYFRPTMVTDEAGNPHEDIAECLGA